MKYFLIGSNGRLGQAISFQYTNENITLLDRSVYQNWSGSNAIDKITDYFSQDNEPSTIFIASGLLDPRLSLKDLSLVNYMLPKNIINGVTKLGHRVITFGTVMEEFCKSENAYVNSKISLSDYIDKVSSISNSVLHVRIHTLYGIGQPSPFMFLGQIADAIFSNKLFKMTSGRQLREYHHISDEANAIKFLEQSSLSGIVTLSHGKPITLRSIAESVFEAFGKYSLLSLSALPEPESENYEKVYQPLNILKDIPFRNAQQGIVEYMKYLSEKKQD